MIYLPFYGDTKSVLFEELLFRGALLYILVQKLGARNGIILSSLCFGVYHWYTYGVFGNFAIMAFVLIMTAIPGLVFAYAFVKTKSMALAIGLHLGWNFTNNSIFANGSWSDYYILIPQVPQTGIETMPHLAGMPINYLFNVLLANIMLPLLTYLVLKYYYSQSKDK
ncbi:hypothetical protein CIB95_04200 [Lottiidibacillus patelloidae]|uniref:CAAX prenyl protease 2/Lysostaphin resistance protein A-like domain-containing protein n=1 Tax=Lottiidibacillus patelloidae TaxID=2670334 RepID=A0A263BV42_9BACI|nr:CPBP family intramembrane glutamic endopeptidase [Lottiidibacillus patelloidae]OZM57580.1 hypothetical protein CIB95_04200 [Lottiidibacillus patelloidae]